MVEISNTALKKYQKAVKYLRMFLMDTPEFNRLIRKKESSDDMMRFAIDMCIEDWNVTSPDIGPADIVTYPNLWLLMHGAAINILKSQGIRQARNMLQYNAGGSSFVRSDKSQMYLSWLSAFASDYEVKKKNLKLARNIDMGWGGIHSEYSRIGFYW